ncbi:hypothetical protein HYS29_01330 [Candidatus Microgenomates bacterium]|nr:hypothetical protein [Candidatus Microgenomates bacterium]
MEGFSATKYMKGQTLIEVLLALGTAVVVLSATVVAVLAALNNAQFSKNQSLATQYAQEGMEVMRKMRNSNWSAFNDLSGSYCLAKDDVFLDIDDSKNGAVLNGCSRTGSPSSNPNVDDIYARQVVIAKDSAECGGAGTAKATVSVSWVSNKCTASNLYCHKVELVSCLGRP